MTMTTTETTTCPGCGDPIAADDITWPLTVDGTVIEGGCTACWEDECALSLPMAPAVGLEEE